MFSCPPCAGSSKDRLKAALTYFWKEAHEDAFACACHLLREQPDNGLAQALVYALGQDLKADLSIPEQIAGPPEKDAPAMSDHWQVLGPFPVAKLELDADPTFDQHEAKVRASRDEANSSSRGGRWNESWALDPAVHVLTLEGRVWSELVPGGWVTWKAARSAPAQQGVTPVFFSQTHWQELAASLQTPVVYEFQAWARAVTFVREAGVYVLNCQGVHSAYLRTLRSSRLLAGDVYTSGQFAASLELSAGPVGIVLPLRGMAQSKFYCHLSPQQPLDRTSSIRLLPPRLVPHLLVPLRQSQMHGISRRTATLAGLDKEWWFLQGGSSSSSAAPRGLLLSGLFALPVSNTHAHPLTVSFGVEAREGAQRLGKFSLKVAWRPSASAWGNGTETEGAPPAAEQPPLVVAPGQTIFVPLELVPDPPLAPGRAPLIPCSPSMTGPRLLVTVTPSRGKSQSVEMAMECRWQNQSFLVSFLDDDGSVTQAAVLFPLPTAEQRAAWSAADSTDGRSLLADSCAIQDQGQDKDKEKDKACVPAGAQAFPVLTSLHGTGIAPLSQADAYKVMPPGQRQYLFGVEGAFVLAPSRFGAHNWEAVGARSARAALQALKATLARVPALPQVDASLGLIAGHSMGAHGALVAAANQPSDYACLSATALWISKEWYAAANAFFQADVQMPLTPTQLQAVLAQALSEFHVDRLASNMASLQTHLRVGGSDATTHPFFTRRMHRALRREGANATLEEVRGKEHWWWDTSSDNDGGVLNDQTMRAFFKHCLRHRGSRPRCPMGRTWTVRAVNPHSQKGECGVAVAQQQRSLSPSSVAVRCDYLPPPPARNEGEKQQLQQEDGGGETEDGGVLSCRAETQNVRALLVSLAPAAFGLPEVTRVQLSVDGSSPLGLGSAPSPSMLCVQRGTVAPCAPHPLEQRLPSTYGPARAIYSRPLFVVYGTPPSSALRVALRDLAVYLGNAIALAHHGLVRVVSDVEFKSQAVEYSAIGAGLLLVGGPFINKAARLYYGNFQPGESNASSSLGHPLLSRATVGFSPSASPAVAPSFSLGPAVFAAATDAVLATFPMLYPSSGEARLGLLLHSNSVQGFFALSRLAWPVVPPMVRAPFAAYLPDYVVLDQRLWAEGFGAVKMAGFWSWSWQPDEPWAFSANYNQEDEDILTK